MAEILNLCGTPLIEGRRVYSERVTHDDSGALVTERWLVGSRCPLCGAATVKLDALQADKRIRLQAKERATELGAKA